MVSHRIAPFSALLRLMADRLPRFFTSMGTRSPRVGLRILLREKMTR
ncbi:hypothetical protein PMIN01_09365 [Paraphaeosphaeria minitans]|uniref:Uncharacterized protein n=1 Tax=Paraphaeosphaeria minitans TaxID=565426 RepID=A0A9P6GBH9_9PLEO|nr:hypothetical protein PMIN01_09365 [Paraphaeosphaeria minitans]